MGSTIILDRLGDRWRLRRLTGPQSGAEPQHLTLGTIRCRDTALRLWLALNATEAH